MKVEVQQIVPRPGGLDLALVIRGPEDSWVRFAVARLCYDDIERRTWAEVGHHVDLAHRQESQQHSLF